MSDDPLPAVAARLRRFADIECESSPLYQSLSRTAAEVPELLSALIERGDGQPPANILLASVHRLLMERTDEPLRAFYPNLHGETRPLSEAPPIFRRFCLDHLDELRALIRSRRVNTNEIARIGPLLPALHAAKAAASGGDEKPVHLIEIGASAGFNLLFSEVFVDYGSASCGPVDAPVHIRCDWRAGDLQPPTQAPSFDSLRGLDLVPVNVDDPQEVAWLKALIWPEHRERFRRLEGAVSLWRQYTPEIAKGSALDLLPTSLDNLSAGEPVVVFHSFVFYQMDDAIRIQVKEILDRASEKRRVVRLGFEWAPDPGPMISLQTSARGQRSDAITLARAEPHGRWVDWLEQRAW
ncbi:MAG: DUF2332 domain-containing protein [Geminicoccaceae bacterium]